MSRRIPVALILVGIALPFGWAVWQLVPLWTPLDTPVSLSAGHIRTPEFEIDVESRYLIELHFGKVLDSRGGAGEVLVRSPWLLRATWFLSSEGQVIARGASDQKTLVLGAFHARKGRYVLDLDVQDDGTRLNTGAPHLMVTERGDKQWEYVLIGGRLLRAGMVLIVLGIWLLVVSTITRSSGPEAYSSLTQPGPQPGPARVTVPYRLPTAPRAADARYFGGPETARRWPLSRVSSASFFGAVVLAFVLPFQVILVFDLITPKGLPVRLLRPGIEAAAMPGLDPVIVRVQMDRTLYINSRLVRREDFDSALETELRMRPPDWPVYVEGHGDLDWGEVVWAVDRVRGHRAQVVLLTRWRGR